MTPTPGMLLYLRETGETSFVLSSQELRFPGPWVSYELTVLVGLRILFRSVECTHFHKAYDVWRR